jgi:hypothetical protein
MSEPKIYVPKCSAKEHVFKDGGSQIKVGFNAAALVEFIKANTNEKGYVNLLVTKRREVGKYGDTHSVALDTWKPGEGSQRSSSAAPAGEMTAAQKSLAERRAGNAPPPEDDGRVPF